MCLYPTLIKNPKYKPNKKNGGVIPAVKDNRVLLVPIGCGKCIECMKQKKLQWQTRLLEEIKTSKNGRFITLTLSNQSYTSLAEEIEGKTGYELDNQIATLAIRRFLERWRKEYKKSVRHWLITELGHNGTENIHLHGIIWTEELPNTIAKIWKYGYIWPRINNWNNNYISDKTVNYICKYVTKIDLKHKTYKPIILTSPGIGSNYVNTHNAKINKYKEKDTEQSYVTRDGYKTNLPIYYKNKLYTEEEKEKLWIEKLDKNERYILGRKVDIKNNYDGYMRRLKEARKKNNELGYGNNMKDWKQEEYEKMIRIIKQQERFKGNQKPTWWEMTIYEEDKGW
jgi:hypothetical protein